MTDIQKRLFLLQDLSYRDFHARLMPTVDKDRIIGVRVSDVRKLANEIENDANLFHVKTLFMDELPHNFYEENNLHAILISKETNYDECVSLLDNFLPFVDNWATCDILRPKVLMKNHGKMLEKIEEWINTNRCYTMRFAIEMLMTYCMGDNFELRYLERVATITSQEYYVKMMIAWYFATALAKHYDETISYIENYRLDKWTHNKTIQKAIESYRVNPEQKSYLKTLKL